MGEPSSANTGIPWVGICIAMGLVLLGIAALIGGKYRALSQPLGKALADAGVASLPAPATAPSASGSRLEPPRDAR